jgi:hypothetical protein
MLLSPAKNWESLRIWSLKTVVISEGKENLYFRSLSRSKETLPVLLQQDDGDINDGNVRGARMGEFISFELVSELLWLGCLEDPEVDLSSRS